MTMKKKFKWILINIILIAAYSVLSWKFLTYISALQSQEKLDTGLERARTLIEKCKSNETAMYERLFLLNTEKARSLALVLNENSFDSRNNGILKSFADSANLKNAYVIDSSGHIIGSAREADADFTKKRFNSLKKIKNGEPSGSVTVDYGDGTCGYFSAPLDSGYLCVIEVTLDSTEDIIDRTLTWQKSLENIIVGSKGYVFVVQNSDYFIVSHPDNSLVGTSAVSHGLNVTDFLDEGFHFATIDNEKILGKIQKISGNFIFSVIPASEITSKRKEIFTILVWVFTSIVIVSTLHGLFVSRRSSDTYELKKSLRRFLVLALAGMVAVSLMLAQSLLLVDSTGYFTDCRNVVVNAEISLDKYKSSEKLLTKFYDKEYLIKGEIAAFIIKNTPHLATRAGLKKISKALGAEYTYVFDEKGTVRVTDSPYDNFSLSNAKGSQSAEFSPLLSGVHSVVQSATKDEFGAFRRYVGISLRNKDDLADGFVQLALTTDYIDALKTSSHLEGVLKQVSIGKDCLSLVYNCKEGVVELASDSDFIGKKIDDTGIPQEVFKDNYNGYFKNKTNKALYYASVEDADKYLFMILLPAQSMKSGGIISIIFYNALITIFALVVIVCALLFQGADRAESMETETSAQNLCNLVLYAFRIAAVFFMFAFLFGRDVFPKESALVYLLNDNWNKGFNRFSITYCFMVICIAILAVRMIRFILYRIALYSSSKVQTICYLLRSLSSYVAVIASLYYCMAQFGVDTQSMFLSVGALSLAISLAAKGIVSDIMAGLFIIAENELNVGDTVHIGHFEGKVVEIGVRVTKIEKDGEIMIINNSDIDEVVNLTASTKSDEERAAENAKKKK